MSIVKKMTTKSPNEDETESISDLDWTQYSDNYISATAPNGYTVLASKSSGTLSLGSSPRYLKQSFNKK